MIHATNRDMESQATTIETNARADSRRLQQLKRAEGMRKADQSIYYKRSAELVPRDYVLTPGGFRHRSLTHHVENGNRVQRRSERLYQVDDQTDRQISLYPRVPKYLLIPDIGTNWITYASWSNETGSPITRFSTEWVVPPEPQVNSGQTLFIFNCIEDASQDDIVQPVLQWGLALPGGGNYWTVANWYVDRTGHASYSTLQRVSPGDTITGVIVLAGQDESGYNYTVSVAEYPDLDLPVNGIGELVWASTTLEAYMISGCSDYPNAPRTSMSALEILANGKAPALDWSVTDRVSDCHQRTVVEDSRNPGGQVDIIYS